MRKSQGKYGNLSLELSKVADYFIFLSNKDRRCITNLKLQKLVYYAQAWNLVFNNRRLYKDPIEAWIHGPAIYSLWQKYKRFGFREINIKVAKDFDFSDEVKEVLDKVWEAYGGFDAKYLEKLTHYEKPWQQAREKLDRFEYSNAKITAKSMRDYYKQRLEEYKLEQQVQPR